MSTIEGGMVCTDDEDLAEMLKHLLQVFADGLGIVAFYLVALYKVDQFAIFK